jgi:hypothetical protein
VGYLVCTFLYLRNFSLREGTILNHDIFVKINFYFNENTIIIKFGNGPRNVNNPLISAILSRFVNHPSSQPTSLRPFIISPSHQFLRLPSKRLPKIMYDWHFDILGTTSVFRCVGTNIMEEYNDSIFRAKNIGNRPMSLQNNDIHLADYTVS